MGDQPKKRGRPRLPEQGVPVATWLRAGVYDRLLERVRREDESVSSLIRRDLELVAAAWRQRKRADAGDT